MLIRFSVSDVEPSEQSKTGAIYLNHHQQNHYNVVLSVNGHESDMTQKQNDEIVNEYEKRYRSRMRLRGIRQTLPETENKTRYVEKRKQSLRKRYQEDLKYRDKKLKSCSEKYLNSEKFQANLKLLSKQRYHYDIEYQNKTKIRSNKSITDRYTADEEYKEAFKRNSLERYASDEEYRTDT